MFNIVKRTAEPRPSTALLILIALVVAGCGGPTAAGPSSTPRPGAAPTVKRGATSGRVGSKVPTGRSSGQTPVFAASGVLSKTTEHTASFVVRRSPWFVHYRFDCSQASFMGADGDAVEADALPASVQSLYSGQVEAVLTANAKPTATGTQTVREELDRTTSPPSTTGGPGTYRFWITSQPGCSWSLRISEVPASTPVPTALPIPTSRGGYPPGYTPPSASGFAAAFRKAMAQEAVGWNDVNRANLAPGTPNATIALLRDAMNRFRKAFDLLANGPKSPYDDVQGRTADVLNDEYGVAMNMLVDYGSNKIYKDANAINGDHQRLLAIQTEVQRHS